MTTNLTTRSAQADTITAVPPRRVPRGTQMGWLVRIIPLALMAVLSIPMAQAQLIYTYSGNDFSQFNGPQTGQTKITVTLSVTSPIPPNLSNSSGYCGTATISDGVSTFPINPTIYPPPTYCYLSTDSNGLISQWNIYYDGYFQHLLTGTGIFDIGSFGYPIDISSNNNPFTYEDYNDYAPGIWFYPTAFLNTNALLTYVTGNNIGPGDSLVDQLTTVLTDINNNGTLGLACSDLQAFANHVKAQTGKKITTAQAATIMQYVAAISAGIPGCQVK